jgi:hypothetical protein
MREINFPTTLDPLSIEHKKASDKIPFASDRKRHRSSSNALKHGQC